MLKKAHQITPPFTHMALKMYRVSSVSVCMSEVKVFHKALHQYRTDINYIIFIICLCLYIFHAALKPVNTSHNLHRPSCTQKGQHAVRFFPFYYKIYKLIIAYIN